MHGRAYGDTFFSGLLDGAFRGQHHRSVAKIPISVDQDRGFGLLEHVKLGKRIDPPIAQTHAVAVESPRAVRAHATQVTIGQELRQLPA